MIYFGTLHSFKDYYLKTLTSNISENFFFEYHYEPINSVDSVLSYISQVSSLRKGIVLTYIKDKNDVSILLKLLKGLKITKKKQNVRVIVVNDFYGLKNYPLLKNKGADVIFEQKATKGAINYAVMKFLNEFSENEEKSYFVDVVEKSEEILNEYQERSEVKIEHINTDSANIQVSLHDKSIPTVNCYLEDMSDTSLILKLPTKSSEAISSVFNQNLKCKINLEYSSQNLKTTFPIYIKRMEYVGDHYFLYARNVEPNADSKKLYDIYGKRQENISKFVYHSRA